MIGMIFKFNEPKIEADGKYTVKQLHDKVDQVAAKSFLLKEGTGHYFSNMDEHAFALVGRTLLKLDEESWFVDNLEEWLLYEDDCAEDVLTKHRERYRERITTCETIR